MSGFSASWLDLREPVDAASRNAELSAALQVWRRPFKRLSVLDLGCGTGANFRFLAPLLGGEQHWRLVDHDPILLAHGARRLRRWATDRAMQTTLAERGLAFESANDRYQLEPLALDLVGDWDLPDRRSPTLLTASALLDLVSEPWLERLAARCRQWEAAVFIALSYDGAAVWEPVLAGDERVRERLNRHQRTDKGFGPALGPAAPATLAILLRQLGYRVMLRPSPWRLGPEHGQIQTALLDGWSEIARQFGLEPTDWLPEWTHRRRRLIERRMSRLYVGHWDVFACPCGIAGPVSIPQPAVE
mgnify:CR=1 FL=1